MRHALGQRPLELGDGRVHTVARSRACCVCAWRMMPSPSPVSPLVRSTLCRCRARGHGRDVAQAGCPVVHQRLERLGARRRSRSVRTTRLWFEVVSVPAGCRRRRRRARRARRRPSARGSRARPGRRRRGRSRSRSPQSDTSATPGAAISRSSISSSTSSVSSWTDTVAEVTAMRITGSALASALTTRGVVDVVGQVVRHAADRVAGVGRRHVEVDVVAELERHPAAAEARRATRSPRPPEMRPDGAFDHRGHLAIDRLGRRALSVVVTVMTGGRRRAARASRRRRAPRGRRARPAR